ncbi:MAG: homoserine dehydrogenase [Deltaproteobacteria bacterium]|nr:homoserine dehydrogenase [Deltaproteobacteria bacterium]
MREHFFHISEPGPALPGEDRRLLPRLQRLQTAGTPLRVALIGAGSMGLGIAHAVSAVPGMEIAAICDRDLAAASAAAVACGRPWRVGGAGCRRPEPGEILVCREPSAMFEHQGLLGLEVLVEASNSVSAAAGYAVSALQGGLHVVLMNAEVDLAWGPLLHHLARENGVVVTSDAGDQHGVLLRQMEEIRLMGLDVVLAGNMKGFLDRTATPRSLKAEARVRHLNPVQCCAYTDGTKLGVEMALVSNATGLVTGVPGMRGPRAAHVSEVPRLFDLAGLDPAGEVDYLLGAEPGGGVFVVACTTDALTRRYLRYYKMGDGPFYLFYRPCHLCHLETPLAIAQAALEGKAVLTPDHGRVSDVYAHAKRELTPGEALHPALGGEQLYGMVDDCRRAESRDQVPLIRLESEEGAAARVLRRLAPGEPLTWADLELPASPSEELYRWQARVLARGGRPEPRGPRA